MKKFKKFLKHQYYNNNYKLYQNKETKIKKLIIMLYNKKNFFFKIKFNFLFKFFFILKKFKPIIYFFKKDFNFLIYKKLKINFLNYTNLNTENNILKHLYFNNVNYIINIKAFNFKILINISNIKGIPIILFSSNSQKQTKKKNFLNISYIIENFSAKIRNLKNKKFAINYLGVKKFRKKIILELNKNFFIKNVNFYNLNPYNGCKPKK